MVRNDLFITVPTFFRCPISLDVMKSPVSLSTGVTYDRSSIQKWLDNGNNTCPATMQVLQSKDFVPNHTLHRLIQIWADSMRNNNNNSSSDSGAVSPASAAASSTTAASTTSTTTTRSVSRDQARVLVENVRNRNENCCFDSLRSLADFAGVSEDNRKFLAKIDGFAPMLLGIVVGNNVDLKIEVIEQAVRVLDLILNDCGDKELGKSMDRKQDFLASIVLVLQKGGLDSRIASARVLEIIAADSETKLLIAEKEGVLFELFRLASETDSNAILAGLSSLIAISVHRRVKTRVVRFGAVQTLEKIISQADSSASIIEKATKLLEMVSTCKEGRTAICEDPVCVTALVQKMLKVSKLATEHATVILWSVCYLFRDQKAQEAVTKSNGLTKMLLLMQSDCSPSVRQMCGDLIKIFRVNSKSCLSSYDTKTTHIMPF